MDEPGNNTQRFVAERCVVRLTSGGLQEDSQRQLEVDLVLRS